MTTPEEWWNRQAPDVQQELVEIDLDGPVPGHLVPRLNNAGRLPVVAHVQTTGDSPGGFAFVPEDLKRWIRHKADQSKGFRFDASITASDFAVIHKIKIGETPDDNAVVGSWRIRVSGDYVLLNDDDARVFGTLRQDADGWRVINTDPEVEDQTGSPSPIQAALNAVLWTVQREAETPDL